MAALLSDESQLPSNRLRRCQGDELRQSVFDDVTTDERLAALRRRKHTHFLPRMLARKPAELPATADRQGAYFDDCKIRSTF